MQISKFIDHTLLKPDADLKQIEKLCTEAVEHQFFSVCVNPCFVARCADLLKNTGVQVCTVVGFPLGATDTATKAFETNQAIKNGATEIDMVLAIGLLKSGQHELVENDIREVVKAAQGKTVKVIIETALLTQSEKVLACELAVKAGAHFVKTSTGFASGGATVEDIALMKKTVGDKAQVKASGGIKNLDQAKAMIAAGANRLGTSSGVMLVQGLQAQGGY